MQVWGLAVEVPQGRANWRKIGYGISVVGDKAELNRCFLLQNMEVGSSGHVGDVPSGSLNSTDYAKPESQVAKCSRLCPLLLPTTWNSGCSSAVHTFHPSPVQPICGDQNSFMMMLVLLHSSGFGPKFKKN